MALAALFLSVGIHAQTNLLLNPGFETGDFSDWTVSGTSPNYGVATSGTVITGTDPLWGTATVIVNSGTYAGYAVVCHIFSVGICMPSGSGGDYLDLSQSVTVTPGATDTASFWVATNNNSSSCSFGSNFAILVDGTPISINQPGVRCTYEQISGTFTTSDSNPTITFQIQGSGTGDAGFSFDDFSVTSPTPEPATAVLYGLGLVGILGTLLLRKRFS